MTIIRHLLTVVLLLAADVSLQDGDVAIATASEGSGENPYRLPQRVVPIHYDVELIPHIVENNFTTDGEMNVDVKVRQPTNTIALHTMNITLDESWTKLTARKGEAEYPGQIRVPKQHHYDKNTQILAIRFDESLDRGVYTLRLKFAGILADDDRGFYRAFYTDDDGNKSWLAMTHFQPVTARQAFPCWDEPAIKATFKFSIKHYPNYTALSNMPSMRTEVDEADGKVWTRFETTPVMSTNVLGFVVADYDHIANLDGTVKIWAPKRLLRYAPPRLEFVERAMRELEKYTNSSIRVPKMDHVVAPQYTTRATENWGMIVYKDNVLLKDDEERPSFMRMYDLVTITHELAHQWFGNLVSPAWWQYIWLSEGISTYMKYLISEKLVKEWRIMDFFVVDIVQFMFNMDVYDSKPININITSHLDIYFVFKTYSANTYTKSCIMLHMLANILTQDVFRNGLIRYLRAHEYGTVTPDDLWKALQDALDESDVPHDGFKVKEVMDTWFEQPAYPIVTIERDYITGEIRATQKKFQYPYVNSTESNGMWWIPINFATQSDLDFSSTVPTHWLRPQESLTIKGMNVNDWIIVNKQLTGYYRVNYDTTNWKRIAGFLNTDDYDKIAVLNRAQIIKDASDMIVLKQLDVVTYLEIVNYLWREVDPVAWNPAFEVINEQDTFARVSAVFKRYIFGLMRKLREHIGFDNHPDDNPLTMNVRAELIKYACTYGDPECRAKATATLLAHLEDPVANKIPYDSRFSIVCFALMTANESVWDRFRQVFNETGDNFVGCSTNPDILGKQLNSTINYPYGVFSRMLDDLSNVDTAIDLFINNFAEISNVTDNSYLNIIRLIIGQSNTEDQLRRMRVFAKQHDIDLSHSFIRREKVISKVKCTLSEIRDALKKKQFSVAMHFANDDIVESGSNDCD